MIKKNSVYFYILLFFFFFSIIGLVSPKKEKSILLGDVSGIPGDANNDGKITSMDYVLIKKHILGTGTLTGDNSIRADINGDSKISSLDYIMARKVILGLLPTPAAKTTPAPVTPPPTLTPTPVPRVLTEEEKMLLCPCNIIKS